MGYVPQGMHSEEAASFVSKDYLALQKPTCFTYPHCVLLARGGQKTVVHDAG
jgi:hypothetical protein